MDVQAYLRRIGVDEPVSVTRDHLERLQRAHLTSVPFENLDVFHRRGVYTEVDWSVPKIVERRRGGWCFELNGAFAHLLEALGFSVRRIGATVLVGTPSGGLDHLAIGVELDRRYLVDVGFGDSFIRPLPLDDPGPHDGGRGDYGFTTEGDMTTLVFHGDDGPEPLYRFGPGSYASTDFEPASHRLQTEPGLQWTDRPFATRLIDGGPDRVTLLADRIRFRRDGAWTEHPVAPDDWNDVLDRWFDMEP